MQLPHYDNLTVEKLFEFAESYDNGDTMAVFPEERKERLKLQRSYIGNCIYTIVGQPFKDWVQERIVKRNEKVTSQ